MDANTFVIGTIEAAQIFRDAFRCFDGGSAFFIRFLYRNDDQLNRRQLRRQTQSCVVAVCHDQPTNHAR